MGQANDVLNWRLLQFPNGSLIEFHKGVPVLVHNAADFAEVSFQKMVNFRPGALQMTRRLLQIIDFLFE